MVLFCRPGGRSDVRLYNAIIDDLKDAGIGFLPSQQDLSQEVVGTLTSVLWFIDPHRAKLKSRSIAVPYENLKGYNDHQKQKKKAPVVSISDYI